jgi:DNA-binding transcriptional ArsR family regulator
MNRRLWHLIAGTRGGVNRALILTALRERPSNANDLASRLGLDYKTVRHHLEVLRENDFVMLLGERGYAVLYSLSPHLQFHFDQFLDIWRRLNGGSRGVGEK